jgi:asparagine N-glycosylation enzyme membrane subunit Stt3
MSPATAVLCLVGCGVLLFRKLNLLHVPAEAAHWQVVNWIILFTLAYLALPVVLPHWLNLRYISVLFGPFYLIGGLGFWYCASALLKAFDRKVFAVLAVAILSIGAAADYNRFQRIFLPDTLMRDLSIKMLLDADKRK